VNPSVCFFTVCGGGEDYDFLLGQIEHHARMGQHVVLDTTPTDQAMLFDVPSSVRWVHEPTYGSGWANFRLRSAVERAQQLAKESGAEVLAYLDCDEFFSNECVDSVFPLARDMMVELKAVTWLPDGPRDFGESEWHRRLWPASMDVRISRNEAWATHPRYNGNPERHPIAQPPSPDQIVRVYGSLHHHLHYAIGEKAGRIETAEATIEGWASGGERLHDVPWPDRLRVWREGGLRPTLASLAPLLPPAPPEGAQSES
jgi:hypothetical protein